MVLFKRGLLGLDGLLNITFIIVTCSHVILAPYTKVEESFSIQAIHDILAYGVGPNSLTKYDHNVFPGAVPRSFIGPLLLSIFSYPFLLACRLSGLIHSSADAALFIRLLLAVIYSLSLIHFAESALPGGRNRFQRRIFLLISTLQFHSPYWAGRTTPNGIISPFVNVALALLFSKRRSKRSDPQLTGLALLTACAVIARIELVGILIPATVCSIFSNRSPLRRILVVGLIGASFALASILLTVCIDTYSWGRPYTLWDPLLNNAAQNRGLLWPELEAVIFNVVEGKSSDWGISKWHAYITSHLPKILSFSTPLFAVGLGLELTALEPSLTVMVVIAGHVATMSLLGHKETRFILYLTPLLNLFSARASTHLWQSRRYRKIARASVILCLMGTAAFTLASLRASIGNYPGAEAMQRLHQHERVRNATVHIDVLPAMTGINLLQSIHLPRPMYALGTTALPSVLANNQSELRWIYDKTENLDVTDATSWTRFDYILSEDATCRIPNLFKAIPDAQFAEFAGISIKKPRSWLAALHDAPSICRSRSITSWSCFDALVPLDFKWRKVVWLCERKTI